MTDWNVVAKVRIMPADVDVDLSKIEEAVRMLASKKCMIHSIEKKPIAFGISAIEVNLLFNDKSGGMEEVEADIRKIEGVGEAEVVDLNRL